LAHKAVRLRKEKGDARFFAPIETQDVTFLNRVGNIVLRPFRILVQEPMLIAITAYMSFLYGSLYLLFEAYPFVFTQGHHFNAGVSGLMFLPIPAGGVIAVVLYLVYYNPRYEHAIKKHAPDPVPPEFRLEMGLVAAPMFAASFFWFAWTSYPSISFIAPMMAGVIMGWAICWIFVSRSRILIAKTLTSYNILEFSLHSSTMSSMPILQSPPQLLLRPLLFEVLQALPSHSSLRRCSNR